MTSYQFVYFSLRARGEPVRWILKATDVDYTEESIDLFTEWKARKADYDWGNLPVLIVNGKQLHQTTVICRYLGEAHDLCSKDHWAATLQQEVVEGLHDATYLMSDLFVARLRRDSELQRQLFQKAKTRVSLIFQNLENIIASSGWIHSDKMTWADVFAASYVHLFKNYFPEAFKELPQCQELVNRVSALPKIATYIKEKLEWHAFETPNGIDPDE